MGKGHLKGLHSAAYLKLILNPLGIASATVLIALIVTEAGFSSARHVYTTYPVTFGLVTSLVTLVLTLSVVDQIVEKRDEAHWEDVRGITLKGLNNEVRATRDLLWIGLFGQSPFGFTSQTLRAGEVAACSSVSWPPRPVFTEADGRLAEVLTDKEWTAAGTEILRLATQQIREGLVRWATMTALAHGDHRILSPAARLADMLETMEFPFAAQRIVPETGCVNADFSGPLRALWLQAITTCVYVEENLVRDLYPAERRRERTGPERPAEPWTSKQVRKRLSADVVQELEAWLADQKRFERETKQRQDDVMRFVEWPW